MEDACGYNNIEYVVLAFFEDSRLLARSEYQTEGIIAHDKVICCFVGNSLAAGSYISAEHIPYHIGSGQYPCGSALSCGGLLYSDSQIEGNRLTAEKVSRKELLGGIGARIRVVGLLVFCVVGLAEAYESRVVELVTEIGNGYNRSLVDITGLVCVPCGILLVLRLLFVVVEDP